MVIRWLYNCYTMVIQLLYNGYTIVIRWLYNRVYVDLFSQVTGVTPKGSNLHNRRQAQRSLRTRTPPAFRLKGGTTETSDHGVTPSTERRNAIRSPEWLSRLSGGTREGTFPQVALRLSMFSRLPHGLLRSFPRLLRSFPRLLRSFPRLLRSF